MAHLPIVNSLSSAEYLAIAVTAKRKFAANYTLFFGRCRRDVKLALKRVG